VDGAQIERFFVRHRISFSIQTPETFPSRLSSQVIRGVPGLLRHNRKDIMLPGLRLVLAAITATFVIVVLGFAQLVKLQVAQSHSASFGPVEARFAGLAFAERADWAPIVTSQSRSLEALAPFGNVPLPKPPRPDRVAAYATAPTQTAASEKPVTEPTREAPAAGVIPVIVARVDIAPSPAVSAAAPEPASTATASPERPPPVLAKLEHISVETGVLETADNAGATQHLGEATQTPADAVATLPPPPKTLTPAVATQSPAEVLVAALHVPLDPTPAALTAATSAAAMPPAAETPPQPPLQIAALPEDDPDDSQTAANSGADGASATIRLPIPRPAIAALPSEIVPLPSPRPATAPPPVRRVPQRRPATGPANKKTLPRPTAPARPAATAAPNNPFAALFGGPSAAGNPPN
jgi:hypothetical protein